MQKRTLMILVGMALAIGFCSFLLLPGKEHKTMLIILAHPDDETTIGAMMANYARQHRVYLVVAADGRYGTRVHQIPEDSLVAIRKAECQCSCKQLGIQPPVMLPFHDSFGLRTGLGAYFKQTAALKDSLRVLIQKLDPGLIIPFGPDGDTGHPDHRIIGDLVTEIILKEKWYDRYPLYYLGWTKTQAAKFGIEELNYLDPSFFNVAFHFNDADEARYFRSIRCYQSQNSPKEIADWIAAEKKDKTNVLYFRKFVTGTSKQTSF